MKKTVTKKKSSGPLLALGAGSALLVLCLGIFLFPAAVRAWIQTSLSKTSGLPVKVDQIQFSLTRPRFSIKGLEFSNGKGFPAAPLARIGETRVHYLPPATIGGWFELKKVEVDFQEFRLMRNEAGSLNLPMFRPLPAKGEAIDELELTLGPLTYTDLSGTQPIQQTFDLKLNKAVYRKVKGVPGILEILNWEVLKRTGVEEKKDLAPLEIKPLATEAQPEPPQTAIPPASAPSTPLEISEPAK